MNGATRSSPVGARHIGVPYSSPHMLCASLLDPVRAAVGSGAPVLAVLAPDVGAALRDALHEQADGVQFADPATVHIVPGFTVASRWARLTRSAHGARPMVISQQVADLPGCDDRYWARLDIGLDVSIDGLAIDVLCAYPRRERATDWRERLHPLLAADVGLVDPHPHPGYRTPFESIIDFPPPPPNDLGPPAAERGFTGADLIAVRHLVAEQAAAAGLAPDRVADVVLAVNELVTNCVEHGPGSGRLRAWQQDRDGDRLVVEVADEGRMDVPFPGLVHPPPRGERGRGLWLASELCDVLEAWSDDHGTVLRVHVS